jgi:hypothetical protein
MVNTGLPFYVGGDRRTVNGINEHFEGRVDDVALWSRALSAAEIGTLIGGYGSAPPLPAPPEQTTNATPGLQPRYFRKTFNFAGNSAQTTLELWPVADDGAIIYLNGSEVWRSNVPVTAEVTSPAFATNPVVLPGTLLVNGTNILSAEVHQHPNSTDLLFGADLLTDQAPNLPPDATPSLVFSEIAGANDGTFFIELLNRSASVIETSGWAMRTSIGGMFTLPARTIQPNGYATFTAAEIGLTPVDGLRLTLFAPGGSAYRDAREITNRLRGLDAAGRWAHPTTPTPGGQNVVTVSDAIVINEIFYHGANNSPEQWIELFNRSASTMDVSLWKFTDGITYQFPIATPPIPAGGFAIVAWDGPAFTALHPGVAAFAPFSGSLSGKGELITLRDANDNIADQLVYGDDGRWSPWADGGGSSLELRDPRADNSKGEAWDASDESAKSFWVTITSGTYQGFGTNSNASDPANYHEFVFGLLDSGEFLIDDISVKDVSLGNTELIQNGTFENGTTSGWRILGTHSGTVLNDPTGGAGRCSK